MEQSFWQQHGDEISAAITLAVAVVVAFAVDRLVIGRGSRRVADIGVSRTAQTRLRLVRRLVFVGILLLGVALALSQFAQIRRLATGILASSAVLGLVVGLAARQTIANFVAGILLAVTQPLRIGDRITFEEVTGRVDDVTLTYTYVDTGDGRLMVIPNETLVSSVVFNHSTGNQQAPMTVSAWLPSNTDLSAAKRVLEPVGVDAVRVADWTPDGLRVELKVSAGDARTRTGDEEAALRERVQQALGEAGLTE